jgi:hypothetical protein
VFCPRVSPNSFYRKDDIRWAYLLMHPYKARCMHGSCYEAPGLLPFLQPNALRPQATSLLACTVLVHAAVATAVRPTHLIPQRSSSPHPSTTPTSVMRAASAFQFCSSPAPGTTAGARHCPSLVCSSLSWCSCQSQQQVRHTATATIWWERARFRIPAAQAISATTAHVYVPCALPLHSLMRTCW